MSAKRTKPSAGSRASSDGVTKRSAGRKKGTKRSPSGARGPREASRDVYDYDDADGTPIGQVVRKSNPKGFFQRRWDAELEQYVKGLDGVRLPLFRLPAVAAAIERGETIYVVEGEKDVLSAEKAGVVATTSPGGAGKWRERHTVALRGAARVVVVADNDAPGLRHAHDVASKLKARSTPAVVMRGQVTAEGADLSDHLAAGYSIDALRRAPGPIEDLTPRASPEPGGRPLPAVARLLIERAGSKAKATSSGWELPCPAHDDKKPSLSLAFGDTQKLVLHCHRGCSLCEIASALGVSPAEFSYVADDQEREIEEAARKIEVRQEAQRRVAARTGTGAISLPAPGRTLVEAMEASLPEPRWAIERLLPERGNALLAAQFKTGKTTFIMNLVRSWVDEERFLGEFPMRPLKGRIAVIDYEMSQSQSLSWWASLGIANADRIAAPVFMRGQQLNLANPDTQNSLVEWLKASGVEVLIVDPAARAMRPTVEDENSNSQVGIWTDALDEVKRRADISEVIVVTHLGKTGESARGASRLSDWPDALWTMSRKAKARRSLSAQGRDVDLPPTPLSFDPAIRGLSVDPADDVVEEHRKALVKRGEDGRTAVLAVAKAGDKPSPEEVLGQLQGTKKSRQFTLFDAEKRGLLARRYRADDVILMPDDGRRSNEPRYWVLTDAGRDLLAK